MKKNTLTRVLALVLCLVMLFLTGCTAASGDKASTDATADGGEVRYKDSLRINGSAANLSTFDFDGAHVTHVMVHDRLVEKNYAEDKIEEVVPGLATEWEWIDDTTLDMKIRDGVKFHNGEPLEIDDILFTFNECVLTHSQASKMNMLDHVEQVDDNTVRFILKNYYVDFLYLLTESMCSIVNREAIEADEIEGVKIGTGPYMITDFVQSDYTILERFDDYWGEKGITREFRLQGFPETSTGVMALENGEADAVTFDVVDLPHIEENPDLTARINPSGSVYVAFNTTKAPGNDKNLRMAVAYAINPDDFLATIDPGYSTPLYTMWGPPDRYGYDDSIQPYGRDLEKAKEYLAKSKYKEITINVSSGLTYIAEVLQANCKDIGLTIHINGLDSAALSAASKFTVAEHEAQIGVFNMAIHGDDVRRLYYPNNNVNKAILTDERIIKLIDDASMEKDDAKRQEMYHEIQQINHEEGWYLPLCLGCETTALNAHVQNVHFEPRGRHQWSYAYVIEE